MIGNLYDTIIKATNKKYGCTAPSNNKCLKNKLTVLSLLEGEFFLFEITRRNGKKDIAAILNIFFHIYFFFRHKCGFRRRRVDMYCSMQRYESHDVGEGANKRPIAYYPIVL